NTRTSLYAGPRGAKVSIGLDTVFDSEPGFNIATIAPPSQPQAYHLIIYRFRPIFAAGAKKACNGR
ncbi:MAG TPA: hypothetical protein VGO49_19450, partial [Bradyrhizobium sp.]|nr:hypothetical protein [Bradyrhizobium sp.]